jgi:hypothetical protein
LPLGRPVSGRRSERLASFEVLFVPLTLAAVLVALEYRQHARLRWVAIAGILCGLAILTRTAGLPIVLALADLQPNSAYCVLAQALGGEVACEPS